MNSQEEWYGYWAVAINNQPDWVRQWEENYLARMNDTDDTNAIWELNQTMIYTDQQAKALADAAVAAEVQKAEKEPLSEEEKDRLWKAVLESCSG